MEKSTWGTKAKAGHRQRRTWSFMFKECGGQGVWCGVREHFALESEGSEEKYRAVIEGGAP